MKVKRLNRVGYEIEVDRNTKRTMKSKETRLSFVLFFKKKKERKEVNGRSINHPHLRPWFSCVFFLGGGWGWGFFLFFLKESAFFCFSFVSFVSSMIIPTVVHR